MKIIEIISTVGFPIACVIVLAAFVFKIWQQSVAREEKLMAEITANRQVNERFAAIIASHSTQLEAIKNDVSEIKEKINNGGQ